MLSFYTEYPLDCGIIKKDKDGLILEFKEKNLFPKGNLANGAVYIFKKEVIKFIINHVVKSNFVRSS